jgi:hypothetical protein
MSSAAAAAAAAAASSRGARKDHDLALYTRLDQQLLELAESFTNLVRAARGPDDEQVLGGLVEGVAAAASADAAAAARTSAASTATRTAAAAPGELPEVLAERVLAAGHACVEVVAELKRGALLSDFDALVALVRARRAGLERGAASAEAALGRCAAEASELLRDLEEHYYASSHPGSLPPLPKDATAERLAAAAMGGGGGGGERG